MESHTVTQLKSMAKAQGLRGYSKLRKAELVQLLSNHPVRVPGPRRRWGPMDDDIPDIGVTPLQPTPATPVPKPRTQLMEFKKKLAEFGEWLLSHVPPKPKVVDSIINSFKQQVMKLYKKPFKAEECKSALRKFTTQYTIEGREGYDPQSFLRDETD